MTNTKIINLFAPPGSGKSTTAAGVFYLLKQNGYNAELATEFAKDLVWAHREKCLSDQFYVFGKQHNRIHRLIGEVDIIVVDSPILLNLAYADHLPECYKDTVKWAFNQYDNINYYINRVKKYNPAGRNQTEQESDALGERIKGIMDANDVQFKELNGDMYAAESIYLDAIKHLPDHKTPKIIF